MQNDFITGSFGSKLAEAIVPNVVEKVKNYDGKVLSFNFTGYEVPYGVYFMNQKTPSLTVTYKTIKFNKAMHERLNCKYIEILYHPILKMIAIKETTEDNPYALCWKNEDGTIKTSLNSKAFSKSIYDRIGWKEDYCFKFRGITRVRGNAKLMIFYLDEPQIIPSKKSIKALPLSGQD